jgi:DNA-binding MarR family transcriptional regulator
LNEARSFSDYRRFHHKGKTYRTDRPDDIHEFGPEIIHMEAALAYVRDSYPNMTVGAFASFLALGRNQRRNWDEARSLKEIAAEIGINYPTFTRHVDVLGDGVGSADGLALVGKRIDPAGGMKERRVAMTERGLG